jgi:uncharacterized protein YecE (DUF72 family)
MYYSAYAEHELTALARAIAANPAGERWCIFDNTASGAAAANGLALKGILDRAPA